METTARKDRLDLAREWAGVRQVAIARSTGTLVAVLNGAEAGLDTDGGRWSLICDDHSTCVAIDTLAVARNLAPVPEEWCEACMNGGLHPEDDERYMDGGVLA